MHLQKSLPFRHYNNFRFDNDNQSLWHYMITKYESSELNVSYVGSKRVGFYLCSLYGGLVLFVMIRVIDVIIVFVQTNTIAP